MPSPRPSWNSWPPRSVDTTMKWGSRREDDLKDEAVGRPVLIHAFDGFLTAGAAPRIAADQLVTGGGTVVHSFEIDKYLDYRARRPVIGFERDHYQDYQGPSLEVVLEHDEVGAPYLVLTGPEPDYRWETFIDELAEVVHEQDVAL